jgi:hypothetical protein
MKFFKDAAVLISAVVLLAVGCLFAETIRALEAFWFLLRGKRNL